MKIKALTFLPLVIATGVASLTQSTSAQTWQTVDDFKYAPGRNTVPNAMTVDPSGNVFAAGWALADHALIRKSSNGGATWVTADDLVPTGGNDRYTGLASDPFGTLYALAWFNSDSVLQWIVRRSADAGTTWVTVASLGAGTNYNGNSPIATDLAGNVYVVGSTTNNIWTVRKSMDGGTSWSIVDAFNPNNAGASPNAVFCHPTAGVFVAGQANIGVNGTQMATVRRSLDGGLTWTTVDAYQLASADLAAATGLGADASGNLYVVGQSGPNGGALHWVTRKSSNGGASWSTVDSFQHCVTVHKNKTQCYGAAAAGFARDAFGNLFVVGSGGPYWIVRQNVSGTGTWQTVDTFLYGTGIGSGAKAVTADNSGHVYVAGLGDYDSSGNVRWIVRKR